MSIDVNPYRFIPVRIPGSKPLRLGQLQQPHILGRFSATDRFLFGKSNVSSDNNFQITNPDQFFEALAGFRHPTEYRFRDKQPRKLDEQPGEAPKDLLLNRSTEEIKADEDRAEALIRFLSEDQGRTVAYDCTVDLPQAGMSFLDEPYEIRLNYDDLDEHFAIPMVSIYNLAISGEQPIYATSAQEECEDEEVRFRAFANAKGFAKLILPDDNQPPAPIAFLRPQ